MSLFQENGFLESISFPLSKQKNKTFLSSKVITIFITFLLTFISIGSQFFPILEILSGLSKRFSLTQSNSL